MKNNWYHITGISGVTTSAIAVMLKDLGFKVTGSDKNIYSPAKDILIENNIKYFTDYSFENLLDEDGNKPDVLILAGSKSSKNKEVLFAKKQGIPIKSYPEILKEFVIVPDGSIVVAGTYGKTSITAMLIYIFQQLSIDISYMVGGFSNSLSKTLQYTENDFGYSIVEGDEYLSSKLDKRSKFFHYSPKYLVINSVEWDHTDLFKSEEEYIENFKELVSTVDEEGVIFVNNSENINKAIDGTNHKIVRFEYDEFNFDNDFIGRFNKENAAFAVQIASEILGVEKSRIQNILSEFKGIKRRMELRHKSDDLVVIDDFGSSPAKAKGAIQSVKESFPEHNIYIVYEPNEGARTEESLKLYDDAFLGVERIFLPEFREMKGRITSTDLEAYMSTLDCGYKVRSLDTESIIDELIDSLDEKAVVLFLGSHDFEYLISDLIAKVK